MLREEVTQGILEWFEENDYAGEDPFDLYAQHRLAFLHSRKARFVYVKTMVEPFQHAKKKRYSDVYAFLLKAAVLRKETGKAGVYLKGLEELKSPFYPEYCWGHDFSWDDNPPNYPYAISTLFVADALLDYYEASENEKAREMAESAGDWLLEHCYSEGKVRYSPTAPYFPNNITAEGGMILDRLGKLKGDSKLEDAGAACVDTVLGNVTDFYWLYSDKSNIFDILHNGIAYSALFDYFTRNKEDPRFEKVREMFKLFAAKARQEPKNLWDYSKFLECLKKYGEPFEDAQNEILALRKGKALKFASSPRWKAVGWFENCYARHNAFAYYSLSL